MGHQPLLHDLLPAVRAPEQAWSGHDGQVRPSGAQGVYDGDVRVLSTAVLTAVDADVEYLADGSAGPGVVEVLSLVRTADEPGADPTLRLRRRRTVVPGRTTEVLELTGAATRAVRVTLELTVACDLASMDAVKAGERPPARPADPTDGSLRWTDGETRVRVVAPGAETDLADPCAPVLRWHVEVPPGGVVSVEWSVVSERPASPMLAADGPVPWSEPEVVCDDLRLAALVTRSLEDLDGLRMRARFAPDDQFVAAGAPWFFTLFGRDSLWAARMLLPLGTELAAGTLRVLAARQGTSHDVGTAEQPGRILHEVRGKTLDLRDGTVLPPLYYGTVDATPLWVCLLHDAWRWGMPEEEVEALLPAAEAALAWMDEHGDADGDGFLEYLDLSGTGLANQGWKDSGDSVQWRDGRLAEGPIALCEVQAYAHEAATSGAALLDAFGRPGADRWREWAADLAQRFRAAFWVTDEHGPYPAIALDADKRPVDALTSNIGHLLGTGLLDAEEERVVAERLGSPELDSGYGLRTMATSAAGYWPMRYHGGSVWTHDTAIAILGLTRSGHGEVGRRLALGLLSASAELGYRLPELYSGDRMGSVPSVVPYPAACRPQAWAAASGVVLLTAFLGIVPDAPSGAVRVRPLTPFPFGPTTVRGLRVGGAPLEVAVDGDGKATVRTPLRVVG